MSDFSPKSEHADPLHAETARQVALLRFETRRLTAQLERTAAALADATRREEELSASFAVALAERDKIFTSKAWRATRALQEMMDLPRQFLASLRALSNRLGNTSSRPTHDSDCSVSDDATPAPEPYEDWANSYDTLTAEDRALIVADIAGLEGPPVVSILIRNHRSDPALLEKTTSSIRGQLYPAWDICSGEDSAMTGTFIAALEAGDILAEHALYEIIVEFLDHPEAALVYTDEDEIDDQGRRYNPVLKPAFSIELQLGCALTGALTVYRRSALAAIGITPQEIVSKSGQMLALDLALDGGAPRIRHLPAVLCHHPASKAAADPMPDPEELAARVAPIKLSGLPGHPHWSRVTWPLPARLPRVSVIIPTRDRADLLARCVLGVLDRTDYPDLEILIIDNDSIDAGTLSLFRMLQTDARVRVIAVPGAFNYSTLNNAGARAATGEILLLLNNDIEVIDKAWLKEMVSHAVRPDVGAVGAKLLFADGTIQHAGVVLGVGQHSAGPGVAGHFGLAMEPEDPGYLGQFALTREVSAVTGACLAVRRAVYQSVGGLNEDQLAVSFNDIDFCLRIRKAGFRIIWTAFAVLYHLESASRGQENTAAQIERAAREADYMRDHWGPVLDHDPFYNQAFDRKNHAFELGRPPGRRKPWLRPKPAPV